MGASRKNESPAAAEMRHQRNVRLGARLKRMRDDRGETLKQVSDAVRAEGQAMDPGRLSRLESGEEEWSLLILEAVSRAFSPGDQLAPVKLQLDVDRAELVEAHQRDGVAGVSSWLTRILHRGAKST